MKNIFTLILLTSTIGSVRSQTETEVKKVKQLPSIAIGAGLLSFNGDIVGTGNGEFGRIKTGYNVTVEQRIGKYMGVSLNGIYGKLEDSQRGYIHNLNFQSKIFQGDLNIVIHYDNDLRLKPKDLFVSPYLFIGFGYLKFDSYEDCKDKNGVAYNYWDDGSIRSTGQWDANAAKAKILRRDYTYETKLVDSTTNYARATFAVPVGIGINLNLFGNFSTTISGAYYFTFSDWIDNVKSGKNDKYIFANISLQYSFTKRITAGEDLNKRYESVDFSSLDNSDTDGDGVLDISDLCQGTPKGAKVDLNGCPEDTDEDGVPDYRDKELKTKKGAMVDAEGVTLTDKVSSKQKKLQDIPATDRSQVFNQNPSLAFLNDLDARVNANKKK